METQKRTVVKIETMINAPVDKVWSCWTEPKHITAWNQASDDWHCPYAENDPRTGGKFKSTMAAKDGSMSFDFEGVYSNVVANQLIEYSIADGRRVEVLFEKTESGIRVTENFEAEETHDVEMQRAGWQAILDNFKKHTEAQP